MESYPVLEVVPTLLCAIWDGWSRVVRSDSVPCGMQGFPESKRVASLYISDSTFNSSEEWQQYLAFYGMGLRREPGAAA